jgi:hypothetical protein
MGSFDVSSGCNRVGVKVLAASRRHLRKNRFLTIAASASLPCVQREEIVSGTLSDLRVALRWKTFTGVGKSQDRRPKAAHKESEIESRITGEPTAGVAQRGCTLCPAVVTTSWPCCEGRWLRWVLPGSVWRFEVCRFPRNIGP